MTSCVGLTEFRAGPLYFFDQPARRNRIKGPRRNIFHFNVRNDEAIQSNGEQNSTEDNSDDPTQTPSGETCADEPDTPSAVSAQLNTMEPDPIDAYQRAAPQLLDQVARMLSRHRWTEEGRIPHGITNILHPSWGDLFAGSVDLMASEQTDKREESRGSMTMEEASSVTDKREEGEEDVRKPQVSSIPRVKKHKHNSNRAPNSTSISFSISSNSKPGWILMPKPPCEEPQQISLCQWVVERLRAAKSPENVPTAEQALSMPLILRHYGDAKAKLKDKRASRKVQPATLVNGIPRLPEVTRLDPKRQKLHYRIHDGSSFIYYPSGSMAVCHSHSGLPCGGFYTNVFSDCECPAVLATITQFGHGAVTHPLSSAITAMWDQDGGFMCDHHGNITKKWSWHHHTMKEKIVIQLSDVISVKLLSGTAAMLSFRCNSESVTIPLSALSNVTHAQEETCLLMEGKFTAVEDLPLLRKTKPTTAVLESKRNLSLTPVSVCSREVPQMAREVEGLEEQSAQWRRRGHAGRALQRLQQRVRNILDSWLDYYRVALGIKCPHMERMSDVPLRTRPRRDVQSAALPSLNPPERADPKPVWPEEGRNEFQDLYRPRSASAQTPLDSDIKLPRTRKRQTKEELSVLQIGPLQIYGNIKLESVSILNSGDLQPPAVTCSPARPLLTPSTHSTYSTPSTPLTVCPALLRAAMLREEGRKRCCCSARLMPVVTDLEYDAFVMGQPPHSQQMLVVCVTPPAQPISTQAVSSQDVLEQLYRKRNKHRAMPCTQCQMDSFRLVRYEMSTGKSSCGTENLLLQQRHNAAPGMLLMYIRGLLLFVGYTCGGGRSSVRDLQKQISRTRRDYRLGLSLPSDYKFSDISDPSVDTDVHNSQDASPKGGNTTTPERRGKANERKNKPVPGDRRRCQRDFSIRPQQTAALPRVPLTTQ